MSTNEHDQEPQITEGAPEEQPAKEAEPTAQADDEDQVMFTPSHKPKIDFDIENDPVVKGDPKKALREMRFRALLRESNQNLNELSAQYNELLDAYEDEDEALCKELYQREGRIPTPEEGNFWYRVFSQGLEDAYMGVTTDFEREGSTWRQGFSHEGKRVSMGTPRMRPSSNMTGDAFYQFAVQKSALGAPKETPLIHSGIWLRFTSPSNAEIASFQQALSDKKVSLGTMTKGLAFSNLSHTLATMAIDFALEHVTAANVHYNSPSDLKEKILQLDMNILLWGFVSTMYPNGFDYAVPCVADPKHCRHVEIIRLQLHRLLMMDISQLTTAQKSHMVKRFKRCDDADLEAYRKEGAWNETSRIWLDDTLGCDLKTPTLLEYEIAGARWIDGIISMSAGGFSEPPENDARQKRINHLALATSAMQYNHWIDGVVIRAEEDGADDMVDRKTETVERFLRGIYSDETYIDSFLDEVARYIARRKLAVIAIKSYDCPKCKTPTATKFHERFPHLVEIDVVSDFFTLTGLKVA